MTTNSGRHFLQIPGPTNVPDRILRAMDRPTIDHRSEDFAELTKEILGKLPKIFQTNNPVIIYPASGTGAWEAALVNTLSPGDTVLCCETGHFAVLWRRMAERLDLNVINLETDWRRGADPSAIADRLAQDKAGKIKAVCIVHNETSTGVTSRIGALREAIDSVDHPALFMVDTISSLASIDYRMDAWGVDVTIAGSQKGLMLPPGLSFNAVSEKALAASRTARLPSIYWNWQDILDANQSGFYVYTPATNLLYGLREAVDMLLEEGLQNVFQRHDRHAEATRRAVRAWDLDILCEVPEEYSSSLTAVLLPDGHNADALRRNILSAFDMSLGAGLGKLAGRVFRIGHLGSFNDLMLAGTLSGVEMGLGLSGIPYQSSGVKAAMDYLQETAPRSK
ncbi:serine--glyoxylate aminotransferase [Iodidimonas nitroreducens]|uniref:Serine--glyoxylate aminotransferase n=1 Tax=Iodidimonas nitroreducens TaxID=1236968 RepID=A0A5A7NAY2_9PROT|nr:aminotransferase class V-fold PLP-dependent enzyme [Iodidimonas nitroreducens]GAK32680.1 serine--glyoxylate aminotransferase [alpha proteobacterium Q-1]GER04189.1 serine--glyoxylate aminotransferase [Iodidimonas nitroreducens]